MDIMDESPNPIVGGKPSQEDIYWLEYGTNLRQKSAEAYNEAAKILVTGALLFVAFYGTMMKSSGSGQPSSSTVVRVLPAIVVLFGVFSAIMVLIPLARDIQPSNITATKKFAEDAISRKRIWLSVSGLALAVGVVFSLALMMVL